MCGVCVGINNNEFSIEDIVRELLQKTDLQVSMCVCGCVGVCYTCIMWI